jgi:hypothetical protein
VIELASFLHRHQNRHHNERESHLSRLRFGQATGDLHMNVRYEHLLEPDGLATDAPKRP